VKRLVFSAIVAIVIFAMDVRPACSEHRSGVGIWSHENLVAWEVVPFDANKRNPEARAEMLDRLGFKRFAYDWREEHIPTFDEEIDTLKRHQIDLLAWWFPFEPDDPEAIQTLETFKRHGICPQLWVMQSLKGMPQTPEAWDKLLPSGLRMAKTTEEWDHFSPEQRATIQSVQRHEFDRVNASPTTPDGLRERLIHESDRIYALASLAEPYGCAVELYNHNGWFGMVDNEIAIIKRLNSRGITNVGIVYNFNHARDAWHDDTKGFPAIWSRIRPYVVAVNITGIGPNGEDLFPSQGVKDLSMMRTIQQSGWRGPIGLIAEKGGDAETTLVAYLRGFDWLMKEIEAPGSGGPRPFPVVSIHGVDSAVHGDVWAHENLLSWCVGTHLAPSR
jgi:hypothetical protein